MTESCPGMTYAKLSWLQAWHIRDETYSVALAELVNAQFHHPFAGHWGDGSTSSSDGQYFRTGSKAESTGHINPKYGSSPGRTFYTHTHMRFVEFIAPFFGREEEGRAYYGKVATSLQDIRNRTQGLPQPKAMWAISTRSGCLSNLATPGSPN